LSDGRDAWRQRAFSHPSQKPRRVGQPTDSGAAGCPRKGIGGYNMGSMIPQDLLEMLVCPVCKESVVLKENGTGLKCCKCGRVYPIQDDIPIMLIDAATIEPHE